MPIQEHKKPLYVITYFYYNTMPNGIRINKNYSWLKNNFDSSHLKITFIFKILISLIESLYRVLLL